MICPECNGRGKSVYYVETDRDENAVTVERRKGICRICNGSGEKPLTNADRIRAMTDEELADFIERFNVCDIRTNEECLRTYCANCEVCVRDWLKQPAEVDGDGA